MSYDIRSYDTEQGDPVVVLVVKGTHDVSRIVQALTHGNSEQADEGFRLVARLKRHSKGRAALALLKAHGGADFTEPDDEPLVSRIRASQGIPLNPCENCSHAATHRGGNDPVHRAPRYCSNCEMCSSSGAPPVQCPSCGAWSGEWCDASCPTCDQGRAGFAAADRGEPFPPCVLGHPSERRPQL